MVPSRCNPLVPRQRQRRRGDATTVEISLRWVSILANASCKMLLEKDFLGGCSRNDALISKGLRLGYVTPLSLW